MEGFEKTPIGLSVTPTGSSVTLETIGDSRLSLEPVSKDLKT
jgi:hypothetical protein